MMKTRIHSLEAGAGGVVRRSPRSASSRLTLRIVAALVLTFGCTLASARTFEDALHDYRVGRWSAAYGTLIELANRGHRDAARMALFMYQYGTMLYGVPWDASEEDVELWTRTAGGWRKPGDPEQVPAANNRSTLGTQERLRPRATSFQGRDAVR